MNIEQHVEQAQDISRMTLTEAQQAIGSTMTVGDLMTYLGIACIGIVAWLVFNRYMGFKQGSSSNGD